MAQLPSGHADFKLSHTLPRPKEGFQAKAKTERCGKGATALSYLLTGDVCGAVTGALVHVHFCQFTPIER